MQAWEVQRAGRFASGCEDDVFRPDLLTLGRVSREQISQVRRLLHGQSRTAHGTEFAAGRRKRSALHSFYGKLQCDNRETELRPPHLFATGASRRSVSVDELQSELQYARLEGGSDLAAAG